MCYKDKYIIHYPHENNSPVTYWLFCKSLSHGWMLRGCGGRMWAAEPEMPKTFLAWLGQVFWVFCFFFFNWRRIYKRQQQNFLLIPRLGIPLKNKVGLAFSCTWVRPGLRGSAHLFLWWNTLGAPPAVPQGQSHPAVCWATRGWAVWKAVATFGLLNTRETWSSWSSSSDKDAEGLEHLPAQARLRELGLFSLQRSHLGTILVQVGTGDAGQHQNSRNNIQCLSRHFWKDYYAEMQLNQNTFSKLFWRCQVIDIWN